MNKHYDNIADDFDKNWSFTPEYMHWMVTKIIELLDFKNSDIFVDIGAGTGLYTKKIESEVAFNEPIYFVEPSLDMTNIANEYNKFTLYNETSEDFLNRNKKFDKILFKEVIHHIFNREAMWEKLFLQLNHNGKFLLITRPQNTKIPLFKKAKEKFKANQPDYKLFEKEAKKVGFKIDTTIESFNFSVDKQKWYTMLRERFMSDLAEFTREDIEKGIEELENQLSNNNIVIEDEIIFIVGHKV
ncbi:MAG: methyltransferase domain-containing protein [Candidatus Marinarcus sp.]|uniref:methyltransferase domain-containing protein n=1 Tax=Candidatus Marinarcus sp. TaxID=3100987 RepID=UPI003B009145